MRVMPSLTRCNSAFVAAAAVACLIVFFPSGSANGSSSTTKVTCTFGLSGENQSVEFVVGSEPASVTTPVGDYTVTVAFSPASERGRSSA